MCPCSIFPCSFIKNLNSCKSIFEQSDISFVFSLIEWTQVFLGISLKLFPWFCHLCFTVYFLSSINALLLYSNIPQKELSNNEIKEYITGREKFVACFRCPWQSLVYCPESLFPAAYASSDTIQTGISTGM